MASTDLCLLEVIQFVGPHRRGYTELGFQLAFVGLVAPVTGVWFDSILNFHWPALAIFRPRRIPPAMSIHQPMQQAIK